MLVTDDEAYALDVLRRYAQCSRCDCGFTIPELPPTSTTKFSIYDLNALCTECYSQLYPAFAQFKCVYCNYQCYYNESVCFRHCTLLHCNDCKHISLLDCIIKRFCHNRKMKFTNNPLFHYDIRFSRTAVFGKSPHLYPSDYKRAVIECVNSRILLCIYTNKGWAFPKIFTRDANFMINGIIHKEDAAMKLPSQSKIGAGIFITRRQLFKLSGQLPSANRDSTYFGIIPRDLINMVNNFIIGFSTKYYN